MKYSIILASFLWLFMLWQFISAIVERGLPSNPVYYVFSIFGLIFGFLYQRYSRYRSKAEIKQWERIAAVCIGLLFFLNIVFYFLHIEILQYIISGFLFWYLVSYVGFWVISTIKQRRSNKELTEKEDNQEYASRGIVLMVVFLVLALSPIIILALLAIILSQ